MLPSDEDEEDAEKVHSCDDDDEEEEAKKAASRKKPADDDEEETEKVQRRRGTTVGDEPEANEEFDEGIAEKANKLTIPKPVKEAMLRTLTEALERLMSVANRVKEAGETDEKFKTPVPTTIGREVGAIAESLEGIGES